MAMVWAVLSTAAAVVSFVFWRRTYRLLRAVQKCPAITVSGDGEAVRCQMGPQAHETHHSRGWVWR